MAGEVSAGQHADFDPLGEDGDFALLQLSLGRHFDRLPTDRIDQEAFRWLARQYTRFASLNRTFT